MPDLNYKPRSRLVRRILRRRGETGPRLITVGITQGYAWATARDRLGIDGKQLEAGYEIIGISEEQYQAFRTE